MSSVINVINNTVSVVEVQVVQDKHYLSTLLSENLDTRLHFGMAVFHPGQTVYFHSFSMNLTSSSKENYSTRAQTSKHN